MGAPFWVNGAAGVYYGGALLGYGLDGTGEELDPAGVGRTTRPIFLRTR